MNNQQVYEWKMSGFAKGLDPDIAVKEFQRIEKEYGSITAENILTASMKQDAVFHKLFEWDDNKAAQQFRLQQARNIINNIEIRVVANNQARLVSAYEVVRYNESNQYKRIDTFTPEDLQQVKRRLIQTMNYLKSQLSFYKEFNNASIKIDEAMNEVDKA